MNKNNAIKIFNLLSILFLFLNIVLPIKVNAASSTTITSNIYTIRDNQICKIGDKTSAIVLKNNIEFQTQNVKIINIDNKELEDIDIVGTGMKLIIDDNIEYILVVTGDVNGDGTADEIDMLEINRHRLLNNSNLTGIYFEAGDLTGDRKVDEYDMLEINRIRLAYYITESMVTISPTSFVYDGTAKTPTITVKDGSKTLVKDTNYTVNISNNINVGTATIAITGTGIYKGTINKTFNITAKPITESMVTLSSTSFVYDGTAKTPTITVKDGSKTLEKNTDYTVTITNNTNVGTAKVTITGKGNYKDTVTKTFNITAKPITESMVTLSPTSFIYDGTAKTPTITVKDGSKTLVKNTDYTVTITNNTNIGTAKVTITGKGIYKGTVTKTFEITAKPITESMVTLNPTSFIYDGTAKTPTITVKDGSKTLVKNTDYAVTISNNTNVGTAKVTITGKGIYKGTVTKTFEIKSYLHCEKKSSSETSKFLNGPKTRGKIEKVTLTGSETEINKHKLTDENCWDASEQQTKDILAWFEDTDNDGYFEVTIGQKGKVIANPNSSYLFANIGYNDSGNNIGVYGLAYLDTSNVTSMSYMFYESGYNAKKWTIGNMENWNTSKVTNMSRMFYKTGTKATIWNIGDLSKWNTSNVTDMVMMFCSAGENATSWEIGNVGKWNISNVEELSGMFSDTGIHSTTWKIGDLSNWNTSKVTSMSRMFYNAGFDATTWNIGNIGNWDTSKVTNMSWMFSEAGDNSTTWKIGDLSNWNTSNVTTMEGMFNSAGYLATTWSIGDLSNWNTSKVTNMSWMFNSAGSHAKTWNIGKLSKWNTSKVTTMEEMFSEAGRYSTTWNDIGTLKIYASDISNMFWSCPRAYATLNIYSNPKSYDYTFHDAAMESGSKIKVNYSSTTTNIDKIIATKSSNSNVVKGSKLD